MNPNPFKFGGGTFHEVLAYFSQQNCFIFTIEHQPNRGAPEGQFTNVALKLSKVCKP